MVKYTLCMPLLMVLVAPTVMASPRSDEASSQGIAVQGECLSKVTQDRAAITIGSTFVAPTPKEASERAIKEHEAIKREVLKLGLKDPNVETANYAVYQECSYNQSKRVCQGFRARISTRFETSEIPRIGDVITVASRLGAQEVSNIETFASPEQIRAAREACLEIATRNASQKAQKLAVGAGVKLGKVISIRELSRSDDYPVPYPIAMKSVQAATMADSGGESPSIDSKPLDLRIEVASVYAIE